MRNPILKAFTTIIILLFQLSALAQNGNLFGKVTTADGKPAEGVTINLKDNKVNTLTNAEGYYQLRVKAGDYVVRIFAVGLSPLEKSITVVAGESVRLDFVLNESYQELQEVVVNGNPINKFNRNESAYVAKVPLKRMENPQVYSSISKQLMTEQLTFTADDAIRNAPGIVKMWEATGRSGDGGSYYSSRGFALQSQLRNGVAGNVASRIDVANLEFVEVIKGPSATLFGSALTSYGGLINRITKRPYDHFGGEAAVSAGSFGFNRISADINTPLDKEKKILFRLNTAYNYEGSFQDNGFNKGLILAPSLTYKVNDQLAFNIDAEFYSGQNTTPQSFLYWETHVDSLGASRADQLNLDYKRSYSTDGLNQTSRNTNIFGQMDYKISNAWKSQTNVTFTSNYSDGFSPYFKLLADARISGNSADVGNHYISRNDQSTTNSKDQVVELQQNFIADFRLGDLRNRFVAGVDVLMRSSDQYFLGATYDTIATQGTIQNYNEFNDIHLDGLYASQPLSPYTNIFKTSIYSSYISDVVNITDNLIATAALRLDYFDNKGSYKPASGLTKGAYNQFALSPKFGVVFQPLKDKIALFANYQNGFTNKTGADFEGNTFKPEQANQIEGGVKLDVFGGRLSSTISYYAIKVKDIIRSDSQNPGFLVQNGTQLSKGIEVDILANPVEGLNIVAGFSYNNSKLEKSEANLEGRRPVDAGSPYLANLWISYRLVTGKAKGLGLGFGGNYASDNLVINSTDLGEFVLPAYTVLNATAFYDRPKFRIGVKVDNLTNKQYWIGYSSISPQKTRSVSASLALKF